MGQYVELIEKDLKINKAVAEEALAALKELANTNKQLLWVDSDVIIQSETLEEAIKETGYSLKDNGEGFYEVDKCYTQKLGDEEMIFDSIAPFVESESYLNYLTEDGEIISLVFNGKYSRWIYPDMV